MSLRTRILDLLERAGSTWAYGFLVLWLASPIVNLSAVSAAAWGALPAALSLLGNGIGVLSGDSNGDTWWQDLLKRAVLTGLQGTILALAVAKHYDLNSLKVAGIAGLIVAASVLKSFLAVLTGNGQAAGFATSRRKKRALGRRTPTNKPALHVGAYLRAVVGSRPAFEANADHFAKVTDWGLYGNDSYGDCGPVSVANSLKLVTKYLGAGEVSVTQAEVFDLYRRSGNPQFNPDTGADDNGVDMQTMLEALLAGGIGGRKPLGFAKVNVQDVDEVRAAIDIFGFVLFGVNLETAQQSQTDKGLWDYKASSSWGGHAVVAGRYDTTPIDRLGVITWAEVVDCTDTFLARQLEEAWVVIWPEHLSDQRFVAGMDLTTFAADYKAITGQEFPAPVIPQPTPTPTPVPIDPPVPSFDPADVALADVAEPWVKRRHCCQAKVVSNALAVWLKDKGFLP